MKKPKLIRVSAVPMSLRYLLKGQLAFLNNHFEVIGVASDVDDLKQVAISEKIKTKPLNIKRKINVLHDIKSLFLLYFFFKKEKPEIVHSITPKAGLLSMTAAYFAKVPIRMHTFTGLIFPYRQGVFQYLLITMDRILCKFSTNIYPEGEGVKQDLIKFNITNKKLKIIANGNINGIDLNYYNPNLFNNNKELKTKLAISEGDFVFIFIGRLVRDKGINELIYAFSKLNNINKKTKLLLVGSFENELDPLEKNAIDIIKSHNDIIHTGFQNDIRPYLSISNIFVFPSYREGFPNVVIQAGAMELPCIVTDINGSNEIITNNKNGFIIPPKNRNELFNIMEYSINNKSILDEMKPQIRVNIIKKYNQQVVWNDLLKEYKYLLSNVN